MQAKSGFSIREKSIGEAIIFVLFMSMACMPFVPQGSELSFLVFIAMYTVFLIFWAAAAVQYKVIGIKAFLLFMIGLFVFGLNFWKVISEEKDVNNWFRSFVPMAFFMSVFLFSFYVRLLGVHKLLSLLLAACVMYGLKIIIYDFPAMVSVFLVGGRLSYYSTDVVVPFPYLGVMIAALLPGVMFFVRLLLVVFMLFFVLIVGYKAQIIFLAIFFGVHCLTYFSGVKRLAVISFGLLATLVAFFVMQDYWIQRFESVGGGGDEVRWLEIKYAWSMFLESPVFGQGLGAQVPLIDTRPDYEKLHYLWEANTVSYIHNFFFYLLMTGGVSFVLMFFVLTRWGFVFRVRNYFSSDPYVRVLAWLGLGLIIFWLTSASFKQIQTVNMLCAIFSMAALLSKKGTVDER